MVNKDFSQLSFYFLFLWSLGLCSSSLIKNTTFLLILNVNSPHQMESQCSLTYERSLVRFPLHRVGSYSFWLSGCLYNRASGGDGIPVELFQILKDDVVKVLHSICQQIWKTQQWPQDWKRSVFIPIPKKGNAKECSNYCTIALISHTSTAMLKILQARLQ